MNLNSQIDKTKQFCQLYQALILMHKYGEAHARQLITSNHGGHLTKKQSYTRYKLLNDKGTAWSSMVWNHYYALSYKSIKLLLLHTRKNLKLLKEANHG